MKDIIRAALDEIREAAPRIAEATSDQMKVWIGEKPDRQPLLLSCHLSEEERAAFPHPTFRQVYEDTMCNLEFHVPIMLSNVRGGAGAVPAARANMGCGIYASFFGLKQTLFDDMMPWLKSHLPKEALRDREAGDLTPGAEFQTGLEYMAMLAEVLEGTGARVYPMDQQGPVDLAHLVYGDALFYDLYDDPDFVVHLLDLVMEALIRGSGLCLAAVPGADVSVPHYSEAVLPRSRGGVVTNEDTSTLLSGEHIRRFSVPATSRVLSAMGGGYVHYCGRNDSLLDEVLGNEHVLGVNFGNPEKHDMEDVIRRCAEAGKVFYGRVPRSPGEDWETHFTRLLRASLRDGRKHLLLSMWCAPGERDEILEAWDSANIAADAAGI